MDPMIILIILALLVALYYGLGQNLEVSSRMMTRELLDAERNQKVRIVETHSKGKVKDTEWKSAVANINKIDELDI